MNLVVDDEFPFSMLFKYKGMTPVVVIISCYFIKCVQQLVWNFLK